MSKSKKNIQNQVICELYEKVNLNTLHLLISSKDIDDNAKKQLQEYLKKKTDSDTFPVKYRYSKQLINKGRLYADQSLSLQNFKRSIRHVLAKDIYHDIDMENAHPCLLLQYCEKKDIKCENLKAYVENREKYLSKIMKNHGMTRSEAKKLILRLCYLGGYIIEKYNEKTDEYEEFKPEKKIRELVNFKNELSEIGENICEIEEELYNEVKQNTEKPNKKGTTMSILAQMLEQKCLNAMNEYFTKQKFKVGVLCFDGLMIEKTERFTKKITEILEACEKYVYEKTKYKISLAEKQMNEELPFELPEFSDFVEDDYGCREKLLALVPKKTFIYCKKELYSFDEQTGIFSDDPIIVSQYLEKYKEYFNVQITKQKIDNYAKTLTLRNKIPEMLKASLDVKNNGWFKETDESSIGKLLFKDGIYDFKTGKFKNGFDRSIVFHHNINYDFPKRNEEDMKYAYDMIFGEIFEKPKPMLAAIATAMAGDRDLRHFYFCPGQTGAGKSIFGSILSQAFGEYVGVFNIESLAGTKNSDDPAKSKRWCLQSRFCRILLSSETKMSVKLDGAEIKQQSGGTDRLYARTHHKEEVAFYPHYTLFCLLNDIPEITNHDEAVNRRLQYIEFPFSFVEPKKVIKPYHKPMDPKLTYKIQEQRFINGFIHLVFDMYKEIQKNGMPEFDQTIKENWTSDAQDKDKIINHIKENFDVTNKKEDKLQVSILRKVRDQKFRDIISINNFKKLLIDELNLEIKRVNGYDYWAGIKNKSMIDND